jgi:hypothetical protein
VERIDPEAFPQPLPVADAFLQALAYAERAGISCVWIDDPGGHFPPEKRPVRDIEHASNLARRLARVAAFKPQYVKSRALRA